MSVEVQMPKFGLTMHEGTVQRYFKAVGESVQAGEPLYEVETEKVLYEVESPADGVLAIAVAEIDTAVECGGLVAVIAEPGEDPAAIASRYRPAATAAAPKAPPARPVPDAAAPAPAAGRSDGAERRPVSPIARKRAAELRVDLDAVAGSGPGGRVTREDVERAAEAARTAPHTQPAPAALPAAAKAAAGKAVPQLTPMRGMRKVIAERMHQSLQQAAQLTITSEADVTAASELRARLRAADPGFDFSYTDLIIQAAARALTRHPRLNSRLTEAGIQTQAEVNVGMAVALDEGLIVPVIRNADRLSLREIAVLSGELADKARNGRLKLEEVSGGTFTVSNLGVYGVDAFTPIINPGEAAILGIGRIVEKPAIYRGEIARRLMMTLSLTFDHRLVDGAPAAQFLQSVVEIFNYGER